MIRFVLFIFGFAWRDLMEKHVRFTSWVNIATVAFVVACLIMAYGWTVGVQAIGEHELQEDPLNRCLWVSTSMGGRPITRELADGMADKIRQRVGTENFSGCYVFADSDFRWHHKSENRAMRIEGRTVDPRDPVLQSINLRHGTRPYLTAGDEGFIVSRPMLTALGHRPDEVPPELKLETSGGGVVTVPVLDVVEPPLATDGSDRSADRPVLPLGHDFLVAEAYDTRIRSENPNQQFAEMHTKKIPEDWPDDPDDYPATIREMLGKWKCLLAVSGPAPDRSWMLTGLESKPTLGEWRNYVHILGDEMGNQSDPKRGNQPYSRAAQLALQPPAREAANIQPRTNYDWLVAYLKRLKDLTPADDLLREEHLPSGNQTVIPRLLKLQNQTDQVLKILTVIGVAVLLLAIWNMFVIEYLRNAQKVPEFGMLKAIGMGRGSLTSVALCEAGILGCLGLPIGLALGAICGSLGAIYQYGAEHTWIGFVWSWTVVAWGVVIAGIICLLGSVSATYRAHRSPACESLRGLINQPPWWNCIFRKLAIRRGLASRRNLG